MVEPTNPQTTTPLIQEVRVNRTQDHSFLWRTANALSIITTLLALSLMALFPLAIHMSTKESIDTTLSASWSPSCEGIYIPETQKAKFQRAANSSQRVYVNLVLPNYTKRLSSDVFKPLSWLWISSTASKVNDYMTWQEDYAIWSFGILDLLTTDMDLEIKVPPTCCLVLGEQSTMDLLAVTLDKLTHSISKSDYTHSQWCNSKRLQSKSRFILWLTRNFMYLIENVKDFCCVHKASGLPCTEYAVFQDQASSIFVPFYLSFLAGIYSPVLLIFLMHYLRVNSPVPWLYWGESIEEYYSHHTYHPDTVFLGFRSPITFVSMVADGICYTFQKFAPWCGRHWMYFIVLIFSPSVIFLKLMVYYYNPRFHALLKQFHINDIDIGFSSMFFGCDKKTLDFLSIIGGPCMFFFLFYVLGTLFLFFNIWCEDYADIALVDRNDCDWGFNLHLDLFRSNKANVQYRILNIIAENFVEKSFSSSFWKQVYSCDTRNTNAFLGSLRFTFSILSHQIPLIFTSHIVTRSYMLAIIAKCIRRLPRTRFPKLMSIMAICGCVIVGICQLILLFTILTIVTASVQFIAIVSASAVVTFVTFPSEAEGYVLFITATLLAMVQRMRSISRIYHRLLCRSVQACLELQAELAIRKPQIADQLITHSNGLVGIQMPLYETIVRLYEPKLLRFVQVIVKMGLACLGLTLLFGFVSDMHGGRPVVHQAIRAITVFFVVKASEIYSLMVCDYNEFTVDEIYKIYIKKVVRRYIAEQLSNGEAAS